MKNLFLYHILTFGFALLLFFFIKPSISNYQNKSKAFIVPGLANEKHVDRFYDDNLKGQINLSLNLARGIPVVFGSSELTSTHLQGLAYRYFNEVQKQKLFAFGHAGFQNFAIMTVLAANRALLKNSRITIIISPTWFEGKYAKGTSLASFFEFCPESYLYAISKDSLLDAETKKHIGKYVSDNYEKIASPTSIHRTFSQKSGNFSIMNKPFVLANKKITGINVSTNFNLTSQQVIIEKLLSAPKSDLRCVHANWDSLFQASKNNFIPLCNNNKLGVENSYYSQWMSNGSKKELVIVSEVYNHELEDFRMLLNFLKLNEVKPVFIISPLNTMAHSNLKEMAPLMNSVKKLLDKGNYTYLDMFTPNLNKYEIGVLEDVMHPYDYGWYIMDQYIADNLYCK